jgi:hypothetical protein
VAGELLVGFQNLRQPLAGGQSLLRGLLILPELGLGDLFFEGLQFLAAGRSVKENSGCRWIAFSARQIRVLILRSQMLLNKK